VNFEEFTLYTTLKDVAER